MSNQKSQEEIAIEKQKLHEILILLEQLLQREEVTGKAIIGCLYDIAMINLINKYCPLWGINSTLKYLVRFPRPIAQSLGVKLYLQPKCPKLITDWLYTLVEFPEKKVLTLDVEVINNQLLPTLKQSKLEIKSLQNKVKILTGSLVCTVAIFTGSFALIAYNLDINFLELLGTSQASLKD
ncbi:hypothetical protein [Geminocystis sp.]|uniref:hypothetical protein n=1 Tax=Geminocystis sp. TaxID=2664100 RepID=UPI003593B04E